MIANSSDSAVAGSGTAPARSYSTPRCTSSVASPPSSRIMFGPAPSGHGAPARCTTSTPRASRPSTRTPGPPRIVRRAGGTDRDRRRRMILGREDVARGPADLGAERHERLDQHRSLNRHVQRAGDPCTRQRLHGGVLAARRHQPRHLVLCEHDLLAAELGERQVCDFEVGVGGGGAHCVSGFVRSS